MDIIFMGTPDLAAIVLESLLNSKHNIKAIVTQPDKPSGRGKRISYSPVKELATEHNIPTLQPKKANNEAFIEDLKEYNPDIIVVAAFGQILPKAILDLPKYGCINVHTSLLPKYRGASPIQWAIINGEDKTGVTIMYMNEGLDTGDIIIQEEVLLDEKETADTLHDKLAICGGNLVLEALDLIEQGNLKRIKQDDSKATYVKTIDKSLGNINFQLPAVQIERLIRGLNPWPSAYTSLNGKNLKIWQADVIDENQMENTNINKKPGEIVEVSKDSIIVKTGQDYLQLLEIQLEGKKRMKTEDFLRGRKVQVGTILGN